jgi:hypothetical protein
MMDREAAVVGMWRVCRVEERIWVVDREATRLQGSGELERDGYAQKDSDSQVVARRGDETKVRGRARALVEGGGEGGECIEVQPLVA